MIGKFLCVEGPDGSGKGEQTSRLVARLEKSGFEVSFFDFPQYEGFFGKMAGKMLAGEYGPMMSIHPCLASLPYALDRFQATPEIRKAMEEGKIAVANRFTLSNIAHQAVRVPVDQREEVIDFILNLENKVLEIPTPDLYIHLDVPTEISQELILKKAQRSYLKDGVDVDELERSVEHQMEALKMYRELSGRISNVVRIDCCDIDGNLRSIEAIQDLVWAEVSSYLNTTIEGQVRKEREYGR